MMKNKEKAYGSIDKLIKGTIKKTNKERKKKGLNEIINVLVEGRSKQDDVQGKGIVLEEEYNIEIVYKQDNKIKYLPILTGIITREYPEEDKEELRTEDLLNENILYIREKLKQKFIHPNYLERGSIKEVYLEAKDKINKNSILYRGYKNKHNLKKILVKVNAKNKFQDMSDDSVEVERFYEIETKFKDTTIFLPPLYFKVHARYDSVEEFLKEEPKTLKGNLAYLKNKLNKEFSKNS